MTHEDQKTKQKRRKDVLGKDWIATQFEHLKSFLPIGVLKKQLQMD
jgi:hypothetical protein